MKKLNQQQIQAILLDQLEFDPTGQLKHSKLDFEVRVQYSIAMSLKDISESLRQMNERSR